MTILNDAGPNFESAAKMTNPSPTNAAVGIAPTIQGEDTGMCLFFISLLSYNVTWAVVGLETAQGKETERQRSG